VKIPCKDKNTWTQPGRFYYGIDDEKSQQLWIDATVELLTNPEKRTELAINGANWARQFAWPRIAARWHDVLQR